MLRGFVLGVGGAAIVMAGAAGCSSDKKSEDKTATEATRAPASAGTATGSPPARTPAVWRRRATFATADSYDRYSAG